MSKETLRYLSPEDAESIEDWASDLNPLIERNPRLKDVDLIIEGGVGTSRTLVHMMRRAFPEALYVGMDTSDMLGGAWYSLHRTISNDALREILAANAHPTESMMGAIVHANCWDLELVEDIARKTGRRVPMFVEMRALNALMDRKMNPWERKHDQNQILTFDDFVSLDTPFVAQIHIPTDDELRSVAEEVGWHTDRFDIGLLLLRKPTNQTVNVVDPSTTEVLPIAA